MPFRLVSSNQSNKIIKPISTYTNNELVEIYEFVKVSRNVELIQTVEQESKKRQILFFLTSEEQLDICKSIFGAGTKWAEKQEVK